MKLILLEWKVLSRGMSKNSSQYLKIQTAESGKKISLFTLAFVCFQNKEGSGQEHKGLGGLYK